MKNIASLGLASLLFLAGCSGDKNLEDYRREQLGQSLARISSVSGSYTGAIVSKIDRTQLGEATLKFQARTLISPQNGNVSSSQNATVSGSLTLKGPTNAELVFDDGFYDDMTGNFQVMIPVVFDGGQESKLSLVGTLHGDSWVGSIEVKGQSEYGGELNLLRNAPSSNLPAIEVGGIRHQQINKMNYAYIGTYTVGGTTTAIKMSFIDKNTLPEHNFYRLFSPITSMAVNLDFTDFELNFSNAIIDDKAGTIVGKDPFDQRGALARATLNCNRFEVPQEFGWNCTIQTKTTLLKVRLLARQ